LPVFAFTKCAWAHARQVTWTVSEVIVLAIISGPSELVIKVRSLRRQSVMPSRFLCRHYVLKTVLLELLYDDGPCRVAHEGLAEPSATISSVVRVLFRIGWTG
jgi:hypothetical protein